MKSTVPNVPKFPSITANQHATEMLSSTKCTGQDYPPPLEYGLSHVFGFSSQTSIDDEEDIAIGQEHFDLTSADISFEMYQNAEPFFVTEVILLHLEPRSLQIKTCMICMFEHFFFFVLFNFPG